MTTPATYKRRLLKLADFLDKLPRKRFNYAWWVGKDWDGKPALSCGTTACALGWATTIPEFRKLGLRLVKSRYGTGFVTLKGLSVEENFNTDSRASQTIFGLTLDEHCYVFGPTAALFAISDLPLSPSDTATPKQVAKHIRRFVEWKYDQKGDAS